MKRWWDFAFLARRNSRGHILTRITITVIRRRRRFFLDLSRRRRRNVNWTWGRSLVTNWQPSGRRAAVVVVANNFTNRCNEDLPPPRLTFSREKIEEVESRSCSRSGERKRRRKLVKTNFSLTLATDRSRSRSINQLILENYPLNLAILQGLGLHVTSQTSFFRPPF